MTSVNIKALPKKSQARILDLAKIGAVADIEGYFLKKIDYNNGLMRYVKSGVSINLYSSTLTVTVEVNGSQEHHKGLTTDQVIELFEELSSNN